MKRTLSAFCICFSATTLFYPAVANASDALPLASLDKVASRLCVGNQGKVVVGKGVTGPHKYDAFIEAVISETGLTQSTVMNALTPAATTTGQGPDQPLLKIARRLVSRDENFRLPFDQTNSLGRGFMSSVASLARPDLKALVFEGAVPTNAKDFFASDDPQWSIKCADAPANPGSGGPITITPEEKPMFAIRNKPEELALSGDAAKEAGSFKLGIEKEWTTDDDGNRKRSTTVSIDGVAGVRLPGERTDFSGYAFAQYNLKRVRSSPAPELEPGAQINDGDTDVLQLGLSFDYFPNATATNASNIWITAQGGYILNFIDNSRQIRFRSAIEPGLNVEAGFCNFGSARFFGKKFAIRCILRADVDVGLWTRDGRFDDKSYDDHVAFGPNAGIEAFYQTSGKSKVIASAFGRYLPVLVGDQRDIWRVDFNLAHRQFFDFGGAIDFGATYVEGLNALTLEKERKLTFGVGLFY